MDITIAELTIPEGKKGTKITIAQMWKLVNANYKDPHLIGTAMDIIKSVPGHDYLGEAEAIFKFVKGYITYRRDPEGVEFVRDPFVTLLNRVGDCDCQAVLVASLAKAAGFPVRFTTVSTEDPEYWNHVFAEINVAGIWLAADTTEPRSYLGWHPTSQYGEKIWGDPANKIITEGGIMLGVTQGEQVLLTRIDGLREKAKGIGGILGGWDLVGVFRKELLPNLANELHLYLTPPKLGQIKDQVLNLAGLMDSWRSVSKLSRSQIEVKTIDKLGFIKNLVGLDTVTIQNKQDAELNAEIVRLKQELAESQPGLSPEEVAKTITKTLEVTPSTGKIFGLTYKTAGLVAGGTIIVSVVGLWLWKRKKGRK